MNAETWRHDVADDMALGADVLVREATRADPITADRLRLVAQFLKYEAGNVLEGTDP